MKTKPSPRVPKTKTILGVVCKRWKLDHDNPKTQRWEGVHKASGTEVQATYFGRQHYSGSYPTGEVTWCWTVEFRIDSWRSGSGYKATFEEAEREARERIINVGRRAAMMALDLAVSKEAKS